MEIQDVLLKKLVIQFRFPPAPRFADVRGALVERLGGHLETDHWAYGNDIGVFREDRSLIAQVTSRDVRFMAEHFEDVAPFVSKVQAGSSIVFETLDVASVNFLGVRTHWLAAAGSFDELRDRMSDRLGTPLEAVLKAVDDSTLSDIGWSLEFHKHDPKYSLRFGPMTREQGVSMFFEEANVELLPLNFLFVDVDRVENESAFPGADVEKRLGPAVERNLAVASQVARALVTTLSDIDGEGR